MDDVAKKIDEIKGQRWWSQCDWCDWPLFGNKKDGCTSENCSQRPLYTSHMPKNHTMRRSLRMLISELEKARAERGDEVAKLSGELLDSMAKLKEEREGIASGWAIEIESLQSQLTTARDALEPMVRLLQACKNIGSSHVYFILQQAWGKKPHYNDLGWEDVVKKCDTLLEALANLKEANNQDRAKEQEAK